MMARASLARSRAVVTWRSSGRPLTLAKLVRAHAEMLCRLVHALDERLLTAGDPLGDHDGDVVGRFDDEELEGDVECDQLTLFQPELAWGLLRRLLGAHELGVGRDGACLQRLEGDVGRHQLGEGGGKPLGVGIFGVEHRAVIGLEDKGWSPADVPDEAIKTAPTRRPRPARLSIILVPSLNRRLTPILQ